MCIYIYIYVYVCIYIYIYICIVAVLAESSAETSRSDVGTNSGEAPPRGVSAVGFPT